MFTKKNSFISLVNFPSFISLAYFHFINSRKEIYFSITLIIYIENSDVYDHP